MPFSRIAKSGLKIAAIFAVSYVVASGISQYWPRTTLEEAAAPIGGGAVIPSFQVTAPQLNAAIILDGNPWNNPEPMALRSGSRFEIGLRSNQNGNVEVSAINPQGKTSRIWDARLQAGQYQRTPALRLDGTTGQETLHIVFKGDGADATLVKEIKILHV